MIGAGVSNKDRANCLWVISSSVNSSHNVVYGPSPPTDGLASITLTFNKIALDCLTDHVDVYDGLPPFILGAAARSPPTFYHFGSFCGRALPQSVRARLGNLVVVFKGKVSRESWGFSARFTVNRCPDNCPVNGMCLMTSRGPECQCRQGWIGAQCDKLACPKNCSSAQGRGVCNSVSV